jgi:hypothetical protein
VGVHRTRGSSPTGTLDRRRGKRLRRRYMSAMRCQVHQYLGDTLIVVLIHVTLWRNGNSGRRLVHGTDSGTARTDGLRTLAPCSVGVNSERRLAIVWRSVDVHTILLLALYTSCGSANRVLPLAVTFRIHRTRGIRWFKFLLPLRTPTTSGTAVFLHLYTRVRKMWTRRPLGIGRRRGRLTKGVSHALRRTVV